MLNRLLGLKSKTLPTISSSSSRPSVVGVGVALFWDLNYGKPPPHLPIQTTFQYLRIAASRFGTVRLAIAFTSSSHDTRRRSSSTSPTTHQCPICRWKFVDHSELDSHFRDIHEREQSKRLIDVTSAKGFRKIHLSSKIENFKKAARHVAFTGSGSSDPTEELRRAGVRVRKGDLGAMREEILDALGRSGLQCAVLVSDDLGLTDVLKEAKTRGVKTVVVGGDGGVSEKKVELRRCADAAFTWKEVIKGKAMEAAPKIVQRWKDKDLLQRLEWKHNSSDTRA